MAPVPQLHNRPVAVLLEWVSRETGREIRFAAPEVQLHADKTILSGIKDVQNLTPMEILDAGVAITDLEYEIMDSGDILIQARGQASNI